MLNNHLLNFLENLTSFSAEIFLFVIFLFQDCDFTLHIFPTADKVVVDGGRPGQHHGGEDDVGCSIDMEEGLGVLQVPGHHHDARLKDQLARRLGQGPQTGQHSMSDDNHV